MESVFTVKSVFNIFFFIMLINFNELRVDMVRSPLAVQTDNILLENGRIVIILKDSPDITIPTLAEILGVTTRAVEKQIAKLKREGRIRRVGPAKGGHWEIIDF